MSSKMKSKGIISKCSESVKKAKELEEMIKTFHIDKSLNAEAKMILLSELAQLESEYKSISGVINGEDFFRVMKATGDGNNTNIERRDVK